MHVTQTYLGSSGSSGLHCYYLFEDYNIEQQALTKRVQEALDDLGADYMKEIDLYRPNERFAGNVAREVREIRPIWNYVAGKMPGFLVTYKPLVTIDPTRDSVIFFSIQGKNEDDALAVVQRIRTLTQENFYNDNAKELPRDDKPSFRSKFMEALEIKPRFYGVALDLKKLIR